VYQRAKYKDNDAKHWSQIEDPVGTNKYDGASFFVRVDPDGSMRYFSRRPSVKGGFPERTESLPHLTAKKIPELAGQVYNVELIHTGFDPHAKESHPTVSGILNSLPPKSRATQEQLGPIRAVLHNVVEPALPTYKDKLLHMKKVQDLFGNPDLLRVVEPHVGVEAIRKLIEQTKKEGREGVVVASLTTPEHINVRTKVKHQDYYNLRVVGFEEELDKNGNRKGSLGSLILADKSGRVVANCGTGFSAALRKEIWENRPSWEGRLVQVKTMGLARNRLRMPVYNGEADGDVDEVV
jgi:hypothetical protein